MRNLEELAKIGYEAYGAKADWKAYNGEKMPAWDELPAHIRERWVVATEAIVNTMLQRPLSLA